MKKKKNTKIKSYGNSKGEEYPKKNIQGNLEEQNGKTGP